TFASTMSASSRARSVITSFIGSARLSAAFERGAEPPPSARQSRRPAGLGTRSVRPVRLEPLLLGFDRREDDAMSAVALGDRAESGQSGLLSVPVDDERRAVDLEHAAHPAVRAGDRPVDQLEPLSSVET